MKKTLLIITLVALCATLHAQVQDSSKYVTYYNLIGKTYYNGFTNGFSRNTIGFSLNKPTFNNMGAAVWNMAQSSPSRGTGINYYTPITWENIPNPETDRIETVRAGWGVHGFANIAEIVVSHHSSKRKSCGFTLW